MKSLHATISAVHISEGLGIARPRGSLVGLWGEGINWGVTASGYTTLGVCDAQTGEGGVLWWGELRVKVLAKNGVGCPIRVGWKNLTKNPWHKCHVTRGLCLFYRVVTLNLQELYYIYLVLRLEKQKAPVESTESIQVTGKSCKENIVKFENCFLLVLWKWWWTYPVDMTKKKQWGGQT